MLTGQTSLPPNQPTGPKMKNVHNFGIFQPIWMKLGMQSLNRRTHHVYVIYNDFSMLTDQTSLPPNQPIGLKVKNVHNFGIFQPIWMKHGMLVGSRKPSNCHRRFQETYVTFFIP